MFNLPKIRSNISSRCRDLVRQSKSYSPYIISLRGESLEVLQSLPETAEQSYQNLVELLGKRYGDQHPQQIFQAQIKKQTDGGVLKAT